LRGVSAAPWKGVVVLEEELGAGGTLWGLMRIWVSAGMLGASWTDEVWNVQSNIRAAADPPLPAAEMDAKLSGEVRAAITGARRRAARDADRQVDTAHLLHSLIEADQGVREVFESTRVARLLGYLVQRSIGFGLQWRASVEDTGELSAVPAQPTADGPAAGRTGWSSQPGWSPAAATALRRAVTGAQARGAARADGVDLLTALVADPESRAVGVLRSAGIDVTGLLPPR
jgi:Clp amino terminal domain, pathogenicity island component